MPSVRTTLLASAAGSTTANALITGAAYAQLEEWAEKIAAQDRQALLNGQPLEPIDRPIDPQHSGLSNNLWWKVALPVFLVPTLLVATGSGITTALASDYPLQGFITFFLFGTVAAVVCLPIALIVGFLIWSARHGQIKGAKIRYAVQEEMTTIWELREDARRQIAQGTKPVTYLEAIGIDPQGYQV